MNELTQELVKELFEYKDGNLYWKIRRSGIRKGYKAGTLRKDNYHSIGINNKIYLNHRLIFLYHHGYLPKFIDHIDRDKANNNIENLREVTLQQNNMNRKSHKNTSSIYKGVSWDKRYQKWKSQIEINGKSIHLGYFKSETEAAIAYNRAAIELFGEYAKLNEINEGNLYKLSNQT